MAIPNKTRVGIAGLVLSAGAYVGVLLHEGYTSEAIIPVKGDVPTIGFGSTVNEDGTAIKMGDKITPQKAAARTLAHIQKDETRIKQCVKVALTQNEYDAYVSLSYNIGTSAFCTSTLVKRLNSGDYAGACAAILMWDKFNGKPLRGLTIRRNEEYQLCIK